MTAEEIFTKLSAHAIKGFMIHEQLADYFDFLNLHGYKACHEYHARAEYLGLRKLHDFYINTYNRLIPKERIENPLIIPTNWYRYSRQDVDTKTKRQAVKDGIEQWITWETEARDLALAMSKELTVAGDHLAADFVMEYAKDAAKELRWAHKKQIDFIAADYNITFILGQQDHYHDWYKHEMKKLK